MYFFRIIAKFSSINLLETIYFALVQSILQYCIIVWGSANKSYLEPLFICQKFILKIIAKKPRTYSTISLFKEIKILKLEQVWKLEILKSAIKSDIFKYENSHYITRGNKNLNIKNKKCTLSITHKSYQHSCVREFNRLPFELKKFILEKTIPFKGLIQRIKNYLYDEQNKED